MLKRWLYFSILLCMYTDGPRVSQLVSDFDVKPWSVAQLLFQGRAMGVKDSSTLLSDTLNINQQ